MHLDQSFKQLRQDEFSKSCLPKEQESDKEQSESQLKNWQIKQLLDRAYSQYTQEIVKQFSQSVHQQGLNFDSKSQKIKWFKEDQFPGPQKVTFLKNHQNVTTQKNLQFVQGLNKTKKSNIAIFPPKQRKGTFECQNIKLQLQQEQQLNTSSIIDKKRTQVINKNKLINQRLTNLQKIFLIQSKTSKNLKEHINKGSTHKFTFDIDGQLLLFNQKKEKSSHQINKFGNRLINVGYKTSPCKFSHSDFSKQKRIRSRAPKSKNNQILFSKTSNILNATPKTINILQTRNDSEKDAKISKRTRVFSNNDQRQTTNIEFFNPQRGIKYSQLNAGNIFDLTHNGSDGNEGRSFSAQDKRVRDFQKFISSQKKEKSQTLAHSIPEKKQINIKLRTSNMYPYFPKAFRAKTQQKDPSNRYVCKTNRISIKNKQIVQEMMQN